MIQHQSSIAEQSNDIERLEINNKLPSNFFKAKKLVLSEHKKDQLIRQFIKGRNKISKDTVSSWFHTNLINYVPSNELNIDTSLAFFRWVDVSLDDVDKLFH